MQGKRLAMGEWLRSGGARGRWLRHGQAVILVVGATGLSSLAQHVLSPANLEMIYLLAVVVAAIYLGRGPSILVALLGVVSLNFFFVAPRFTLAVSDVRDLLTLAALLIVGLVISSLAASTREQTQAAEHRAAQNAALYTLSRDLAAAADLPAIVRAVLDHVGQTFSRQVAVFVPAGGQLRPLAASPEFEPGEEEQQLAQWSLDHGQPAGRGTEYWQTAGARYLPLKTAGGVVGVLSVRPADAAAPLTADQRQLLEAFASQAALAIERAALAERAKRAEVLQAAERLQTALLNSISHDLRTPLVSITGALSSLQEDGEELDPAIRQSLVDNAREEAERLNRLVGNLLDLSRIEAGALSVRRELCDVEDLIGAALGALERAIGARAVDVRIAPGMPLLPADFVLMEQVLVKLLDNALKYSPPGSPVQVEASEADGQALVQVCDRGIGIPAGDLGSVFEKFYRVRQPGNVTGTGLGLSICKGIVEAHGGRIWARNREGGGTCMVLAVPLGPAGEG